MTQDKSLVFYGKPYHAVIDTLVQRQRKHILELIPEGSIVLDVGCGTGELAFELRKTKGCKVVGVDLSRKMIAFAASRNTFDDVEFLHRDATDIGDFLDKQFEYAILCQVIHKLTQAIQLAALEELMRVARTVVIVDYHAPMPWNVPGIESRLIEHSIGRDHLAKFESYLDAGGVPGILEKAGHRQEITHRPVFNGECHQLGVIG